MVDIARIDAFLLTARMYRNMAKLVKNNHNNDAHKATWPPFCVIARNCLHDLAVCINQIYQFVHICILAGDSWYDKDS
jgi:hypothetical protein